MTMIFINLSLGNSESNHLGAQSIFNLEPSHANTPRILFFAFGEVPSCLAPTPNHHVCNNNE